MEEAEALTRACDRVLSRSDGKGFAVMCLVDAERDPSRKFELERAAAKEILATCRDQYSPMINGARLPATLEIVEVRGHVTAADLARLHAFSNRFFDNDAINAFAIDLSKAKAMTATRWSFWSGRRRLLERTLKTVLATPGL